MRDFDHATAPPSRARSELAADLRLARAAVLPLVDRFERAAHIVDLLDRDLLPRCAEGAPYLVCGIVGPNNAGKSALFNALVGRDLSPSEPTGGATRRMLGVAHPDLLARLQAHTEATGFTLREVDGPRAGAEAVAPPESAADLPLVADPALPPHLLLIDTPDFDSIFPGNRRVSEALAAVADIVVAVVTRHSYQNRAVVTFFQEWLGNGRPWIIVYNEAIDVSVARSHVEKLIGDIGSQPLAAFWAPHRIEIQQGLAKLEVEPLPLGAGSGAPATAVGADHESGALRELLFDTAAAGAVKEVAFRASLERIRSDLDSLAGAVAGERDRIEALRRHATGVAIDAGRAIARQAMPLAPFVEAFRVVLDRRSNVVSRNWRTLVRSLRVTVESVPRWLGWRTADELPRDALAEAELAALRRVWPELWETMARDLGVEARSPARRQAPAHLIAALDSELGGDGSGAQERAAAALRGRAPDLAGFQRICERLVDEAIDSRGFEFDMQRLADLATVAPVALAAAVIVTTGGMGADVAVAGGGAVGAFFMEKYSHLLGSGITRAARSRWAESRGDQLGAELLVSVLPATVLALDRSERDEAQAGTILVEIGARLR